MYSGGHASPTSHTTSPHLTHLPHLTLPPPPQTASPTSHHLPHPTPSPPSHTSPTQNRLPHFTPSPLTPTVSPLWNPPQDPSKLKAKPAIVSEVPIPNGDRPPQAFQSCCPGGQPGGRAPAALPLTCSLWSPWESHTLTRAESGVTG